MGQGLRREACRFVIRRSLARSAEPVPSNLNASKPMLHHLLQRIAGLLVSLGFIFIGLVYLNGAFFSAWLSGGPPNPYPLGWERRAIGQLVFSVAAFVLAVGSYKVIVALPNWRRPPVVLVFIGIAIALTPFAGRFLLQDQCLDQGGQWSNRTLECTAN